MKRIGLGIFVGFSVLTVLLLLFWLLGFLFAISTVGALIHFLLIAALFAGAIALVGLVLYIVGFAMAKKA